MSMNLDNESWLIEIGEEIIEKKAAVGICALTNIEHAIYCLWVIDYAVRNSGSLEPVKELYPTAIKDLSNLSQTNSWLLNSKTAAESENPAQFCSSYYESFENRCGELRSVYENT